MGRTMKAVLWGTATVAALQGIKHLFGYGPSLVVSVAALSFSIGAIWGASRRDADGATS